MLHTMLSPVLVQQVSGRCSQRLYGAVASRLVARLVEVLGNELDLEDPPEPNRSTYRLGAACFGGLL